MVYNNAAGINNVYAQSNLNAANYQSALHTSPSEQMIFGSKETTDVFTHTESVSSLREQLAEAQDKQGIFGKAWNGFKNLVGLGLSSNDVNAAIEQYENGEIGYDEAKKLVDSFKTKQDGMVNILTNVAAGVITASTVVATGGLSLGVVAAGAAVGGAAKAGLKTVDRATNAVEGDALDLKQIAKDGISGAIDGAVSVATAGIVKVPTGAGSVKEAIKQGAIQGAEAGAISGAVSGAGNYTVEAAFEDDVDFTLEGLAGATVQNAIAGGVVGGVMGGVTSGVKQNSINKANNNIDPDPTPTKGGDGPDTPDEIKLKQEAQANARAEEAVEHYKNGDMSYEQAKNEGTMNLNHDQKKIVKQQMKEAHSNQRAFEAEILQEQKADAAAIQEALNKTKSASQGMPDLESFSKGKVSYEDAFDGIISRVDSAETAAKDARELFESYKLTLDMDELTSAQRQNLTRLENQVIEAENNASKLLQKANQSFEDISGAASTKQANIKSNLEKQADNILKNEGINPSTATAEQLEIAEEIATLNNEIKMSDNAAATQANAAKRATNAMTSNKRYQQCLSDMRRRQWTLDSKGLKAALNSKNKFEKAAAETIQKELQKAASLETTGAAIEVLESGAQNIVTNAA